MASGSQDINHLDEKINGNFFINLNKNILLKIGKTPDIIDNAFVIIDFENGARASLDLCMFAEQSINQEEIVVVCDKGSK